MNRKPITLLSVCLILLKCASYAQSDIDSCKINNKIARKNLNCYYSTKQDSFLLKTLTAADKAMKCSQTKTPAISMKITCLIFLKAYKSGYGFIESLSDKDFKYPYEKDMYLNYLTALNSEAKSDTTSRNLYLNRIISEISEYIEGKQRVKNKIDEDAYYNMFFAKFRMERIDEICGEIDKLKVRFPAEIKFWNSLKSTLIQASKNKMLTIPPSSS